MKKSLQCPASTLKPEDLSSVVLCLVNWFFKVFFLKNNMEGLQYPV